MEKKNWEPENNNWIIMFLAIIIAILALNLYMVNTDDKCECICQTSEIVE